MSTIDKPIRSSLPIIVTIFHLFSLQVLAIFIIGLIVDPLNSFHWILNRPQLKLDDVAVIYISVAGYMLINILFLISRALGDRVPKRTVNKNN